MDFNINNFPDGVNVNVNYVDGMEWLLNSQPSGSFRVPAVVGKYRGFDWWKIDTSKLTSISQGDYDYTNNFLWNPDKDELSLSFANATGITNLMLSFEGVPDGGTIRFKDLDNVTYIERPVTSGATNIIFESTGSTLTTFNFPCGNSGQVRNIYINMDCSKLTSMAFYSNIIVNYVSGFPNLKNSFTSSNGLQNLQALSTDSCLDIMRNLYDFTGHGEVPTSSQGKLKVHSSFISKVGDNLSIATDKGWTITT